MRGFWLLAFAGVLAVMAGCGRAPEGSDPRQSQPDSAVEVSSISASGTVSGNELERLLRDDDEVRLVRGLNDVKRRGASTEALGLLQAVWLEDLDAHPDLAWATLLEPEIRLNIVDILVQAAKNGELETEPAGAHAFVRSVIERERPIVASQGVITLALFDRPGDIPFIEQLANQQNEQVFRSAVIALSMMCGRPATEALARLEVGTTGSSRDFVQDTMARMSDFRQRTGDCAQE